MLENTHPVRAYGHTGSSRTGRTGGSGRTREDGVALAGSATQTFSRFRSARPTQGRPGPKLHRVIVLNIGQARYCVGNPASAIKAEGEIHFSGCETRAADKHAVERSGGVERIPFPPPPVH